MALKQFSTTMTIQIVLERMIDYAVITDWQSNDIIRLVGETDDYFLGATPQGLPSGVGIFLNDGANPMHCHSPGTSSFDG